MVLYHQYFDRRQRVLRRRLNGQILVSIGPVEQRLGLYNGESLEGRHVSKKTCEGQGSDWWKKTPRWFCRDWASV